MSNTPAQTVAGIYVRISEDAAGQGLGVQRQEQDCKTKAQAMGWAVHKVYSDNDVSATRSQKRPAYAQMLADLEAGTINAVVVYSLDRLTRRPTELEDFIVLTERYQTKLANVSGDIDLSTANGKMVARLMGTMARAETDRLGERVSRQRLQAAQMGKPDGGRWRLYGYDREWNIIEPEATVVRKMFELHIAGNSVTSVMKYMSEQTNGIFPPTGNRLYFQTVKGMLQNPRYAAILPFKGEQYAGNWKPIIPEDIYRASRALWTEPKMPKGHNTRKSLLTGFLYCGVCDSPLRSRPKSPRNSRSYACRECSKVTHRMDWLDDIILKEVGFKIRKAQPQIATIDHSEQIARIEQSIEDLRQGYAEGELTYGDYAEPLTALRKELARLQTEQGSNVAARQQQTWFKNYTELKAADLSEQRTFLGQHIRAIRIDKSSKRGGKPAPDLHRITVSWAEGYDENLGQSDDTMHEAQVWQDEQNDESLRLNP